MFLFVLYYLFYAKLLFLL